MSKNNDFVAGSLKLHLAQWRKITSDPWVLQTIRGYRIEFIRTPIQKHVPNHRLSKFSSKEIELIDKEVNVMLKKKAISTSPFETGQFISDLFLVKKKNGKFRPVINLKGLNKFIQ